LDTLENIKDVEIKLEKIKWYLWHGNTLHTLWWMSQTDLFTEIATTIPPKMADLSLP
jgi:hypothetical protein